MFFYYFVLTHQSVFNKNVTIYNQYYVLYMLIIIYLELSMENLKDIHYQRIYD